jgi:hypothetical protein
MFSFKEGGVGIYLLQRQSFNEGSKWKNVCFFVTHGKNGIICVDLFCLAYELLVSFQ